MATNCMIYVKINKEDFGKTLTADINKLPNSLVDNNYPFLPIKIHPNPIDDILYMGIYCHFDGYPSGVGAELKNKFNTYESALNLILLGNVSHIIDNICSYHNWRNEPVSICRLQGTYPPYHNNYTYIFEHGEWRTLTNFEYLF
jgi:hypothetical protein